MKKYFIYSIIMLLSWMAITACSQRVPCPTLNYPMLTTIDKIPPINIKVQDGVIETNSTQNVFKGIKALRESEKYYYQTIEDYKEEFIKK